MPIDLKGYPVFVASPSGLDKERKAFRATIDEYNNSDGLARKIQFIPVGWEDTLGGVGRVQSTINKEVRKCDYFVMILHDRWGTKPGRDGSNEYSSGTEEEYNIAMECFGDEKFSMKQIIVFFKSVDERQLSDPGEQLSKVLAFRKNLETNNTPLFHVYDTVGDLEKWLRKYLLRWVRDHESGIMEKVNNPIKPYDENAAQLKGMSKSEIPEEKNKLLEKDIKELLKKAKTLVGNGKIVEAETVYAEAVVQNNSPVAINAYGNFLLGLGRLGQAEAMYKRVMEIAKNIGEEEWEPVAYGNLGLIYKTRGELDKAEKMLKKALEIAEKMGDKERMSINYGNLGLIYQIRGELDKAEQMFNKALAIHEKLGNQDRIASNYGNLGLIYKTHGELDKAEQMLNKTLAIHEKLGNQEGMAIDYGNLGLIYKTRGELDKAEETLNKGLKIDEKLGRLEGLAAAYGNLGLIYQIRGELDKAEQMHKKALGIDEKLGNQEGMANDYGNLGLIYERRGDIKKAKDYWEKALELYKKIGMPEAQKVQGWIDEIEGKGK